MDGSPTVPIDPIRFSQTFLDLISLAIQGRAEVSIEELFNLMGLPFSESTLDKVQDVCNFLSKLGLEFVPPVFKGELSTVRRLRLAKQGQPSVESARSEIINGEGPNLEFKSSLLYDHHAAEKNPSATRETLKSDGVLHSCLKTLAAFLNTNGGVLYLGVLDSGAPIGIESDFLFLKENKRNSDSWELMFRDYIRSNFMEGDNVNDYVHINLLSIAERTIARVEVFSRKKLSYVKHKGEYSLYRRQGNRTALVTVEQVEEFLSIRRQS